MIGSLLLIGTVAATGALIVASFLAAVRGRWRHAKRFAVSAGAAVGGYLVLLLVVSFLSRERVISLHSGKKFCGADCDLSLAVDSAERVGDRYLLRVKVQSSAARVTMTPSAPTALLVDEQGRVYTGSDELDPQAFARPVGPGESYIKTLVYRVPAEVRSPRVWLQEGGWITRIVIGDEGSFLHKKTLIALRD